VIKEKSAYGHLEPGQRLSAEFDGSPVTIKEFIAEGGQGEVYSADRQGEPVAVKWYFKRTVEMDQGLQKRLRTIRDSYLSPPSPKYLWPKDLVFASGPATFGYIMPLMEKRFKSLDAALYSDSPPGLRVRATAGFKVVDAYQKLHAEGLCYQDVNFGNVALDPQTGDVRICDCDNVSVNGEPGRYVTPGFVAPEIIDGTASPTRDTDLWSIAVLLFRLFLVDHPLLGARDPMGSDRGSYGKNATFIWDPRDDSNRPLPGEHDQALAYWKLYPQLLRDYFTQAFTVGIREPAWRVRETEWLRAMAQLRDSITPCPHCTAENFYEREAQPCWNCQEPAPKPVRLELGARAIVMAEGAEVYGWHLNPVNSALAGRLIARVVRHPDLPDRLGLENLAVTPWRVVVPTGDEHVIHPNKRIRLEPGIRIDFGSIEGRVT
jgi:DNA-binding helix-hairpin-helix protein with protein kinase domain